MLRVSYHAGRARESNLKHGIAAIGKVILVLLLTGPLLAQQAAAAGKRARPGDHIKECRNCPALIVLPAGSFTMGSPADEPERDTDEPQQRITIKSSFAIATTPVTWNQWE